MGNLNIFQIVILGVFAVFLIAGFLIFAGVIPIFQKSANRPPGIEGTVTIWGTIPQEYLKDIISELNNEHQDFFETKYVEKRPETFDRELVEALASASGPDVIFLPEDLIVRHENKVFPIPYENYPLRDFLDTYIEEGELYLRPDGILALPFSVDPIVMYWNRDLFASAGISQPPKTWDEFFSIAPRLTQTDKAFNVRKSAIAFGEYRNVTHAKDIIAMLILQAGNPIVEKLDGRRQVVLSGQRGFIVAPAESSLRFYTEFSNPVKTSYSWNRALPEAKDFFASGDLAVYFGFSSELPDIRAKSPHLNFDIAMVPQTLDAERKTTFGKMQGFAVLKQSPNSATAFFAVFQLANPRFIENYARLSGLPPVRRDLLAARQTDAVGQILYDSALVARSFLDPDPEASDAIFRAMVENIVSGRSTVSGAVGRAQNELRGLFESDPFSR